MLTLEKLKEMQPDLIFAQGVIEDSPKGINIGNTGNQLKWVAIRGGIHDWAIYADSPYESRDSFEDVARYGNKVISEENIRKLVPCDTEAFKKYRY